MIRVIKRVVTKQGAVHPLSAELSGKRAVIRLLETESPMILTLIDDERTLRTSYVEAHSSDWQDGERIQVQTANSVYVLEREKEVTPA